MSTGENQGGNDDEWIPPDQRNFGGQGVPPPPPGSNPWGSSAGQPQWQSPYGGYGGGQSVDNHLVWAILTTLFCCMPFGIVSIVFSTQVGTKQAQGDYAGAVAASNKAKNWAIASAVSGIVIVVLVMAFGLLGVLLPFSQEATFSQNANF